MWRAIAVIGGSLLVALILALLPLPDGAEPWRPDWVALVLIYWCIALPDRVGVGIGWAVGLALDVLSASLLGLNALGFAFIAYVALRWHLRARVYRTWQRMLWVAILILVERGFITWVHALTGHPVDPILIWAPVLTSAALWPWVFVILRDLRRRAQLR
ncbi:MAG: rod shape-determining protein MreD [Chromatiales bacterium]|nr:rod shape-determining protein MreD [Chromatiales bacterium]